MLMPIDFGEGAAAVAAVATVAVLMEAFVHTSRRSRLAFTWSCACHSGG